MNELASKYSIDLFCGTFIEKGNKGLDISSKALVELGNRGIMLTLDIYDGAE